MTISKPALDLVRSVRDGRQLERFALRLLDWILVELDAEEDSATFPPEGQIASLLRDSGSADRKLTERFHNTMRENEARRVALYELLDGSGLANEGQVQALAFAYQEPDHKLEPEQIPWLSLATAAYAWRTGYLVGRMDPGKIPDPNSPAGQTLQQTARFMRRQVERNPLDRRRLDHRLNQSPERTPALEELSPPERPVAPLPPHFRPPVPERYVEMSPETIQLDPEELLETPSVTVEDPLVISAEELPEEGTTDGGARRMPPIRLEHDQVTESRPAPPSPIPSAGVVMPSSTQQPRPSFTVALRQMFRQEELTSAKLRVLVERFPDGPGVFGVQVCISSKGIGSHLAGTTNRQGLFTAELPVRVRSGLTYDVDVTWPRELDGEVERKSITLNADRTTFTLPFYRWLEQQPEDLST